MLVAHTQRYCVHNTHTPTERQEDSLVSACSQAHRQVRSDIHKHKLIIHTHRHTYKHARSLCCALMFCAVVVVAFVYALLKLHLVCLVSCQPLCDRHTRKFETSDTVALYNILRAHTLTLRQKLCEIIFILIKRDRDILEKTNNSIAEFIS